MGLDGHSDGDVGYHSLCDAMLGALALGDIGIYFPSSDKKWKNANSLIFLKKTLSLIHDKGYTINNLDCTIILQSPHINKYISKMKKNLSSVCKININTISINKKTYQRKLCRTISTRTMKTFHLVA